MKFLKNSCFQLSRVIFPNWGFYDQVGDQFQLLIIDKATQKTFVADFHFELKPVNFLFNSINHVKMAEKNVLEHFIADIQSCDNQDLISQLSSYKILIEIIKSRTSNKFDCFKFQVLFKKNTEQQYNSLFESDWLTK